MVKTRKLRKLRKGEHRYLDISEKTRITKPKKYKKWKELRTYTKTKRTWIYKPEVKTKLIKRFKEAIKKRKETIKIKRERAIKEITEIGEGKAVAKIMKKEMEKFKTMYRVTIGLNYVVKHDYYSYIIQVWALSKKQLEAKEDEYVNDCIKGLEKQLGFKKSEWWTRLPSGAQNPYFTGIPHISYQEVPFEGNLISAIDERNEFFFTKGSTRAKKVREQIRKNMPLDSPDWF